MIHTHGALERSHREAWIHGRDVYSSSSISPHHPSPCLWRSLLLLYLTTVTAPSSPQSEHGSVPAILPEMRCCASLLHSSKKDTQVVGNKCSGFIPAKGVALSQILLHLLICSWYILYFFFNKIFLSHKFSKKAREQLSSTVMTYKHHLEELSGAASTTGK